MRPLKAIHIPLFLLLAGSLMLGCRKDEVFTDDPGARLDISVDTVLYDTIFTTVGSVTKRFTVHNRNTNAVRVDIALEGGSPSPFRINVDGASGLSFSDVEILGEDSLYIFVEATLDANNANNPLVIEDRILFNTNGNAQQVLLVAWGQDAHFFYPDRSIPGFPRFSLIAGEDNMGNPICETITWPNDKPYVIYGYGVVDSCSTLIIEAGVNVYLHGSSGLWVYRYGRIQANGTTSQPIVFQGDRLEPAYQDLPGQWDRIWINEGPNGQDNVFTNVEVRNSLIGIQAQAWPLIANQTTSENKLVLNNVAIRNASAAGILSENYRIESNNLLIADCGQYCMALTGGGEYFFNHSTVANHWGYDIRTEPAFILTNSYRDVFGVVQVRDVVNSSFRNGIITGNNTNEFLLELNTTGNLQFQFDHFLLRTDQNTSDPVFFPDQNTIWKNQAPAFVSISDQDLHLTGSDAAARDRGIGSTPEAVFDLDGVLRGDGFPDLGCYEFVP